MQLKQPVKLRGFTQRYSSRGSELKQYTGELQLGKYDHVLPYLIDIYSHFNKSFTLLSAGRHMEAGEAELLYSREYAHMWIARHSSLQEVYLPNLIFTFFKVSLPCVFASFPG